MRTLRMLIVEDDRALLATLKGLYRGHFSDQGFDSVTIEEATTIEEARALARTAANHPYDLVSLDVNLGDKEKTGLDVLSTLRRFGSAWMVALLTGVETDESLDKQLGEDKASNVRQSLRQDAYARFPAERLVVVEKPSPSLPPSDAELLLSNRVKQIALIYGQIGLQRFIFKPIEVTRLERVPAPKGSKAPRKFIETAEIHWQIRFDCGDIRTLSDRAGFRTLHHLLSLPRTESLTPEEAMVIEPKQEKSGGQPTAADPVVAYFEEQGLSWSELDATEQGKLIQAALSLRFKRYVELRELQDDEDLSPDEEDELARLVKDLGPLAGCAETAYLRLAGRSDDPTQESSSAVAIQEGLHIEGGNYERKGPGRRGEDSPAAQNFRARMMRTKNCLRENGFAAFAKHLDDHLTSTGANWSYHPPQGIEWTL